MFVKNEIDGLIEGFDERVRDYRAGLISGDLLASEFAACWPKLRAGYVRDNPCDKHTDVVASGFCPACLVEKVQIDGYADAQPFDEATNA